ncbi:MAG TPA: hypothetical protein VGD10_05470 [Allosphingosinicella sp.]|uniref:hypothetical protein n=1 Tax=Allosphingosinicella sp. TaxID=2823234 RepID=UPI002ED80B46
MSEAMDEYRLIFFENGRLVDWETVAANDPVEAIGTVASRARRQTVEVWRDHRKLAVIRPTMSVKS